MWWSGLSVGARVYGHIWKKEWGEDVELMNTHDTIICTALAAEVKGLVLFDTVVDDSVGEHGLVCDSEDEDTEGKVVGWLRVSPHG